MGRPSKRKLSSLKNMRNAMARRWMYRHQASADQQQTGSSEHSSSEIVGNVLQNFPPFEQSQTHSFTFEAKPNLSKIETQSATRPGFESTDFLFKCSSEHASSEIGEIDFPALQQSDDHFPTFKPKLSHIVPQPNSPPHSASPALSFKSSSEHLSSSSPSFDILGNGLQQSNTYSSTSKPDLPHTEPQPTSSPRSASNAFHGRGNFNESDFDRITTKCANCNCRFAEEIERNVKFNLLNNNNNEIQIIDAIFSIYGLTVADWSQTLTSDEENGSVFTYVSELVFEKGISFCSDCSLALQNVYTSHQTLKKFSHNESLFTKALNTQSSCKMQIKTEEGDENEMLHTNDHKKGRQETKDEGNELEDELSFFEPMMDEHFDIEDPLADNLDNLQPCLFTHFPSANATTNVTESRLDLSTTDVRPKIKGGTANNSTPKRKRRPPGKRDIKFKTDQKYLALTNEPSEDTLLWSLREIKELNQKLGTDCFLEENLKDCFVRIEQMPPDPYGIMYSFNVFCCGTMFYTNRAFIRHKLIMHEEEDSSLKLAKCGICERFISLDNVSKHMRTILHVNGKQFKCTQCDMTKFKHRCGLFKHFKTHNPNYVSWFCDICEIHLNSEYSSIVHKIIKHSETPEAEKVFPCNKCEATFVKPSSFKSHYGKHRPSDDRTCKICDVVFVSPLVFHRHFKVKHGEYIDSKHICRIFNIKFTLAKSLQNHKARNICNLPKRRFVCEKCGKTFLSSGHLKRHMQQHEDIENPNKESFKCPICEKILKHGTGLKKHLAREHPKEPRKLLYCEKCGKTTKNLSNMRIHMKVHENRE